MKYREILEKLTSEQKLALIADIGALSRPEYREAGIPPVNFSDLREMNGRMEVKFPTVASLSDSWDPELMAAAAKELSAAAKQENVSCMFTPEMRVKSSPYQNGISEDPYLAGAYAKAVAGAVESAGVTPCLAGGGVNRTDAEYADKEMDERALYEYYLSPFAGVFEKSGCLCASSVNRNGQYARVDRRSDDLLHAQAGAEGFVVRLADADHLVESVRAGDLCRGGDVGVLKEALETYNRLKISADRGEATSEELEAACENNFAVSGQELDAAADRAIDFAFFCDRERPAKESAPEEDLSLRAAEESVVLLKNQKNLLPLKGGSKVAIIGRLDNEEEEQAFEKLFEQYANLSLVGMAAGYGLSQEKNDELIAEACGLAAKADAAVLLLNAPRDAERLKLSADQLALADSLQKANPRVVAIVCGDRDFDTSFDKNIPALLFAPSRSEKRTQALYRILTGRTTPSGKLASTLYEQTDEIFAALRGDTNEGKHKTGLFLGYRRYDTAKSPVKYPFGFGLSYTSFTYSKLVITGERVELTVKNSGKADGCEIVQLYLGKSDSALVRPLKELKGFLRVPLKAGQSKRISFRVNPQTLSVYENGGMAVENGIYDVYVGSSVSDIRLRGTMRVAGQKLNADGKLLTDYLESLSNVLTGGYTLGPVKKVGAKGAKLRGGSLIALLLSVAIGAAAAALHFSDALDSSFDNVAIAVLLLSGVAFAVSLIIFVVSLFLCKKEKRRAAIVSQGVAAESGEIAAERPLETLFDELYETETAAETKEAAISDEEREALKYFDASLTFPRACEQLALFAAERGIAVGAESVRKIFAAFYASRLILLKSAQPALLAKLIDILGEYFGCAAYFEPRAVRSAEEWMFTQTGEDPPLKRALHDAPLQRQNIHIAALKDVRCDDLERIFMPFAKYANNPEFADSVLLRDGERSEQARFTPNLWFVFALGERENFRGADAYLTDLAFFIDVDLQEAPECETKTPMQAFSYYQLIKLGDASRNAFALDEETCWKKIDRLFGYVSKYAAFTIPNKSWTKQEKFSSAYLACGGEQASALDCMAAGKLLLPVLAVLGDAAEQKENGLSHAIETIFGEENCSECKKILNEFDSAEV